MGLFVLQHSVKYIFQFGIVLLPCYRFPLFRLINLYNALRIQKTIVMTFPADGTVLPAFQYLNKPIIKLVIPKCTSKILISIRLALGLPRQMTNKRFNLNLLCSPSKVDKVFVNQTRSTSNT